MKKHSFKNTWIFTLMASLIFLQFGCKKEINSTPIKISTQLHKFYKIKSYFNLKDCYYGEIKKLSKKDKLYFGAIINNVFNRPEVSNNYIEQFLTQKNVVISDSIRANILKLQLNNFVRLYEYRKAAITSRELSDNYKAVIDSSDFSDIENEINIWKPLSNVPKQLCHKTSNCTIPLMMDKVGLTNINVVFQNQKNENFIFDTGANFSTIRNSMAKELGMDIINTNFSVKTLTGVTVNSKLAIAREITIGSLHFNNVVFLVFDDKDLSFPQIDYHINGIIGFPVIESMEEIHIYKDKLVVPVKVNSNKEYNFAIDGFTPIVNVNYKDDKLPFSFDTGANATTLFNPFYKKYQNQLGLNQNIKNLELSGAGGKSDLLGLDSVTIDLGVGKSYAKLENLQLITSIIKGRKEGIYGNLGQDFIKKFNEMIIDFKNASIQFRQ